MLPRDSHTGEPVDKMVGLKEDRKTLLERNNTSVMNVAEPLVKAQPLSYIRESIVERNLMHVMSVQSLSPEAQT